MDGIKDIKTVADLKAAFPDLTKQIEEAATDAERKRIQDIEDVAIAGYETIVADAKFKTPIAAGDVAKAILAEQKKQGGKYIQDRDDDAHASGAGDVGTGGQREGAGGDGPDKPGELFCGRLSRCNGGPRGFEREERQEIRPRETG